MKLLVLICGGCIWFGNAVSAATFTAFLVSCPSNTFPVDPSEVSQSNGSSAEVSCGTVTRGSLVATGRAAASPGKLSAYASALATRLGGALVLNTNSARTTAAFTDTLSINWLDTGSPVLNGSASFEIDLLGTVTNGAVGSASLMANNASIFSFSASEAGTSSVVTNAPSTFLNGQFSISGVVGAWANSVNPTSPDATTFAVSDFGSSLRFTGLSIFDDVGTDITSLVSVTADSGFDYITGIEPHSSVGEIAPVPLPATLWMLLAALAGLLGLDQIRFRNRML